MKKELIVDYKEFLQIAFKNKNNITDFKYYDNRLLEFKTPTKKYEFVFKSEIMTPNKFVKFLGFDKYTAFVYNKFSKLKDFTQNENDALKWYGGYFGGLVNVNFEKVNNYVGTGEVLKYYDYDINQAYLKELTNFLPTRFINTITLEEFENMLPIDKIPYFYFFEIELSFKQTRFFKCFGDIKGIYSCFDFLNSKQQNTNTIIVSEKRLNLINQIYFKNTYTIKKVYVFERHKYNFYEKIVDAYLQVKNEYGKEFKQNALRLYGTLGQIFKTKNKNLRFEKNGNLIAINESFINFDASPQIAMWVADSVAEKLFNIITTNFDKVISWNTDGLVSSQKLNLKISKKIGCWKVKEITGTAFLFNENGARLFFKKTNGELYGTDAVIENENDFYFVNIFHYSNINKGYVEVVKKIKIDKFATFDKYKTYRSLFFKDWFRENILMEKVEEF